MSEGSLALSANSSFCSRLFAPKVTIEKGATALAVVALALAIIGALAFRIHYPATVAFLNEQAVRIGLMAGGGALFVGVIISVVIREMRRKPPIKPETAPAAQPTDVPALPPLPPPAVDTPVPPPPSPPTVATRAPASMEHEEVEQSISKIDREKQSALALIDEETIAFSKLEASILRLRELGAGREIFEEVKQRLKRVHEHMTDWEPLTELLGVNTEKEEYKSAEIPTPSTLEIGSMVGVKRSFGETTFGLIVDRDDDDEEYTILVEGRKCKYVSYAAVNELIATSYDMLDLLYAEVRLEKQSLPGKNPEDYGLEGVESATPLQSGDVVGVRRSSSEVIFGTILECDDDRGYTIWTGDGREFIPNSFIVSYDEKSLDRAIRRYFQVQSNIEDIRDEMCLTLDYIEEIEEMLALLDNLSSTR